MILRSLISLLFVFGLANTIILSASTSQLLTSQQVEWYSNGQSRHQTSGLFQLNQVKKEIDNVFQTFNQFQANELSEDLSRIAIRQQKQQVAPTFNKEIFRVFMPQYPAEDHQYSLRAS